jgi:hypothetical protein
MWRKTFWRSCSKLTGIALFRIEIVDDAIDGPYDLLQSGLSKGRLQRPVTEPPAKADSSWQPAQQQRVHFTAAVAITLSYALPYHTMHRRIGAIRRATAAAQCAVLWRRRVHLYSGTFLSCTTSSKTADV